MAVTLSRRDVALVQGAFRTLLTPWQHPTHGDWARAICQSVRELASVDSVVAIMRGAGEPTIASDGALSVDAVQTYAASWHHRIPGDEVRREQRLTTWVRQAVWPTRELKRTPYYNEYCVPFGNRDSAGMSATDDGSDEMVVFLSSNREGAFVRDGREASLLELLQPALCSGARSCSQFRSPLSLLHATDACVAVFDLHGRLIHATASFNELMSDASPEAPILDVARRLARDMAKVLPANQSNRATSACTWRSLDGRVVLDATRHEPDIAGLGPLCIVVATRRTTLLECKALQDGYSLTARETEVAALLARGRRNREIARALSISEHTARRHTERVFHKLGVNSRAQVASLASGQCVRIL